MGNFSALNSLASRPCTRSSAHAYFFQTSFAFSPAAASPPPSPPLPAPASRERRGVDIARQPASSPVQDREVAIEIYDIQWASELLLGQWVVVCVCTCVCTRRVVKGGRDLLPRGGFVVNFWMGFNVPRMKISACNELVDSRCLSDVWIFIKISLITKSLVGQVVTADMVRRQTQVTFNFRILFIVGFNYL